MTITELTLGLFVFYDLFSQLIAGLRACMYYYRCLSVHHIVVSDKEVEYCSIVLGLAGSPTCAIASHH